MGQTSQFPDGTGWSWQSWILAKRVALRSHDCDARQRYVAISRKSLIMSALGLRLRIHPDALSQIQLGR